MSARDARAVEVTRRGRAIMDLCRKIEGAPSESTFITVECGLHSGFPPCCIEFFVTTWRPLALARLDSNHPGLAAVDEYRQLLGHNGYIPCPSCLQEKRAVRVKHCDWHLTAKQRRRFLTEG